MAGWTTADIPAQRGRSAVVTGTGGLGFQTALALAHAGAEVILAGRNPDSGAAAVSDIRAGSAIANIRFELLDLASLASIAAFAERMTAARQKVDVLINNAAVMAPPRRQLTADGFELQFGVNYLGAFALTARLAPLLRQGQAPRVVTVASIADRSGLIAFDDLQSVRRYRPMQAYSQSKLADLMFALELQRRSDAAGWGLTSIAAHPGISRTDLFEKGAGPNSLTSRLHRLSSPWLAQPAAQGALPQLFAAASPDAKGGGYYGPDGFAGLKGWPAPAPIAPRARNIKAAARLWDLSERLTGVAFA
jgi:NAD(P)-dependent dehydrogenase (short-subunit alcohol dehydrogenase family)